MCVYVCVVQRLSRVSVCVHNCQCVQKDATTKKGAIHTKYDVNIKTCYYYYSTLFFYFYFG